MLLRAQRAKFPNAEADGVALVADATQLEGADAVAALHAATKLTDLFQSIDKDEVLHELENRRKSWNPAQVNSIVSSIFAVYDKLGSVESACGCVFFHMPVTPEALLRLPRFCE